MEIFKEHSTSILPLDYDLGLDENGKETGYDFVKWICEFGRYVEKIYLHTDNTVGHDNMFAVLKASQKRGFISDEIN
ncbi:MAG: cyclic-phosphate processing receiver domain-containing protein [Solibacillus sp.]